MADSATASLRLRDQETGGNDNLWGTYTDTNFTLVEEAVSGVLSKSVAGSADVTLTSTNFTSDESRHAVLELTGVLTGNINVIIPNAQKTYFIYNNTSGSFTLSVKTSSGTAVEIPQSSKEYVYCDGSNAIVTLLGTTHSTNVATVAGQITPTNNISTVAGIAANVTSVAGVSSDVTTVATAVTAGHVETVSSINAAGSSVSSNMPDVVTVAGDSANLQTVAGQISGTNNIATLAGISANITTVAGISSAVSTTATNVAAVTNFSDVYIGAASSNPSTRSDGSSLAAGDLYFNTSSDALFVYSGSAWQAAALSSSGFIAKVASTTDNAVARYSGTGGATLQNSSVTIDDSNNVSGVVGLTTSGDITVADDKYVIFGGSSDVKIGYDETTNDALQIGSNVEAAGLKIHYYADEADDNADNWLWTLADGGTLTWASKISGSYVTHLTLTPNSTVASSTLAAGGNLTVAGNLTVSGTTTTVNSTVTTIKDPLIDLGGSDDGGAPASDDNKDRGLILQYHTGAATKKAFIGYDDSASKFTMIADASVSSEVVSGSASTVVLGGVEFTDGTTFTTVPHNLGAMIALGVF